jgi:hypothetical protein
MEDEVGSTEFRGESEVTLILIVVFAKPYVTRSKAFFYGNEFLYRSLVSGDPELRRLA